MMINITRTIDNLDWSMVNEIFKSANFGDRGSENLKEVFSKSEYKSFAFDEKNKLIGFGRMLSDGKFYGAIYDVIVIPEMQNRGIGKMIVNGLMEQGMHLLYVTLFATPGKMEFYKRLGFKKMSTAMLIPRSSRMEIDYCE